MKIELTDRDKRTLTILGVFVIVVCIGYWGVFGQIKKANDYKDEIEEQENLQRVNETKVMQLSSVEFNNQELETLIDGAKDNYYPIMDSEEVDKLVTNTLIEKYGLFVYDLTINENQVANLGPYQYSLKALTGYSEAKQRAMSAAAPIVSEDGMILFSDELNGDIEEANSSDSTTDFSSFDDLDIPTTGIYVTTVSLRIGGEKEQFQVLLDDLATTQKKLRLVDYSVETEVEQIEIIPDEMTNPMSSEDDVINENIENEVTFEEVINNYLDVTVELYMCQE